MKTVLVTGPIGGGKSTVCSRLRLAGYPVYDCDSRCKALYDSVPGLKASIENELGLPFERWNEVFADTALLDRLEGMVYPLLIKDLEDWKASQDSPVAFIESAVALQKPAFDSLYDSVLLVLAPYELRLLRNPRTAGRNALQSFDSDRIEYTICNDSDMESLNSQIDKYLATL